jgi:isopentenyldiphosphate isomerase
MAQNLGPPKKSVIWHELALKMALSMTKMLSQARLLLRQRSGTKTLGPRPWKSRGCRVSGIKIQVPIKPEKSVHA